MTELIEKTCAYHHDKTAETNCGSCNKPLCLIDTFEWTPIGGNTMEVCVECEDFFTGKDFGKRQKFRLWSLASFVAIVAIFGVSSVIRKIT